MIKVQPSQPVVEPPQPVKVQPVPSAASTDAALAQDSASTRSASTVPPSTAALPAAAGAAVESNQVAPMPDAVREAVVRVITLLPSHLVITNEVVSGIRDAIAGDPDTALATHATHTPQSVLGLIRGPG